MDRRRILLSFLSEDTNRSQSSILVSFSQVHCTCLGTSILILPMRYKDTAAAAAAASSCCFLFTFSIRGLNNWPKSPSQNKNQFEFGFSAFWFGFRSQSSLEARALLNIELLRADTSELNWKGNQFWRTGHWPKRKPPPPPPPSRPSFGGVWLVQNNK